MANARKYQHDRQRHQHYQHDNVLVDQDRQDCRHAALKRDAVSGIAAGPVGERSLTDARRSQESRDIICHILIRTNRSIAMGKYRLPMRDAIDKMVKDRFLEIWSRICAYGLPCIRWNRRHKMFGAR